MLRFNGDLVGPKLVDLSTGRPVGKIVDFVINPNNLSVAAFVCDVRSQEKFLLTKDIHDYSGQAVAIQNETVLSDFDDLIKIQEYMKINYQPIGKTIRTDLGRKLGVVSQYAVDDSSFNIEKIYARPPITKMLTSSDMIVSRSQVIEVNDKAIVVRDSAVRSRDLSPADA